MNVGKLREYCLSRKGTAESFPFDEEVAKQYGKTKHEQCGL
jgi:hypothetical protein